MDGTVLVTGATAGIGQELARRLLQEGARVIVHGRSHQRATAAAERIGGGEVAVADLASFAQVGRSSRTSLGALGRCVVWSTTPASASARPHRVAPAPRTATSRPGRSTSSPPSW